ncbi:DUF4326 domain-containing protein [Maricaulis maris]|uniref:DUF4326 domain-containing protein n=1 Tax=Maricaulis maris TaxID=74318 RepID=UPI003B8B424A
MPSPRRIRLRRTKGFRKPPAAITVTRATRWGNPYLVAEWGRHKAVALFREAFIERGEIVGPKGLVTVEEIRAQLKGKDLCCYCNEADPCHAEVLLWVANSTGSLKPKRHVTGGLGIGEKPSMVGAIADQREAGRMPGRGEFDFILDEGVTS